VLVTLLRNFPYNPVLGEGILLYEDASLGRVYRHGESAAFATENMFLNSPWRNAGPNQAREYCSQPLRLNKTFAE
jgi:hypothetical protein